MNDHAGKFFALISPILVAIAQLVILTLNARPNSFRPATLQRGALAFALLAAALVRAGAAVTDAGRTNLVIGLLLPPEESQSASIREGVQLAIEERGPQTSSPVRLAIRGRVGQWGADAEEAARLVSDDGAVGLMAPPDGAATHLVLQVAGRTAVPVVSLCADTSVTKTAVPWVVRVVPSTVQEAQALFSGLKGPGTRDRQRCVALAPGGPSGREIARDLKLACHETSFALEQVIQVDGSGRTNDAIVNQALKAGPELILVWLDPAAAGAWASSFRAAGFKGLFAGPARLRSAAFAAAAGKTLDGFVLAELALDAESELKRRNFRRAFRNRFGREPDLMSVFSYDAANLLVQVLEVHGVPASRRFPIQFAWPGASGALKFDSQGNRRAEFVLTRIHSGIGQEMLKREAQPADKPEQK